MIYEPDAQEKAIILGLQPDFQVIVRKGLHMANDDLGIRTRATDGLRDRDRQAQLFAQHLSDEKLGWHNVGLALDWSCYDEHGVYIRDGAHPFYGRVGLCFKALGCKYPIILASGQPDYDHAEYHPSFTLQQFLDGQKGGLVQ